MGFANLIADAFSMGFGDYISSLFESRYILAEKRKESAEFDINREYETNEMVELYQTEGLSEEDSKKIVDILVSKPEYKDYFIKSMVKMELDLEIPDEDYKKDIKKEALVTFVSFIIFGFVPLITYLIAYWSDKKSNEIVFIIDCFITLLTIIFLGYVQAVITKQPKLQSCVSLTINGFISTCLAFGIGFGLEKAIN